MNVVVDTNVFVSGLLTPAGPCGDILRRFAAGAFTLCWNAPIIAEYREVLMRPRFQFDPHRVHALLTYVRDIGQFVEPFSGCPHLPDPDDCPFLEAALSAPAPFLVTGNTAHFPARLCRPVTVLLPAQFLHHLHAGAAHSQ